MAALLTVIVNVNILLFIGIAIRAISVFSPHISSLYCNYYFVILYVVLVAVLDSVPSIPHSEVQVLSIRPVVGAAEIKKISCHALPEERRDSPIGIGLPSKENLKVALWIFIVIGVGSVLAAFLF
jgi:hypothetical protein